MGLRIGELIQILGNDAISFSGDHAYMPSGIANDSRKATPGCIFVCIKGYDADGHKYAENALSKGAAALISQKPLQVIGINPALQRGIKAFVQVQDSRRALAAAAHLFYGEPTKRLKLVGVTGTKGKTTTVHMIRSILQAAGISTGMLGTVENDIGGEILPAAETTPGAVELAGYFARMLERGCSHAVMEVSSQGLALSRVDYCDFDVGVFTNFYKDHISPREHASLDEYFEAKLKLFSMCGRAAVNADIAEYAAVRDAFERSAGSGGSAAGAAGIGCIGSIGRAGEAMLSFSADDSTPQHKSADVRADRIELLRGARASTRFCATTPWFSETMETRLPGRYNISNALAAISVCGMLGIPPDAIREGLRRVNVRGRTQAIDEGQDFNVLVDYAHNAASLDALLKMLREYGYSRVTTVFGCGGGRARERRYEMGEVSGRHSNYTIITSDNPRNEDPRQIMADIEIGLMRTDGRYIIIEDRGEAIGYAIKNAISGELVLIAGKGHETTQTFADRTIQFDDARIARDYLQRIGNEAFKK